MGNTTKRLYLALGLPEWCYQTPQKWQIGGTWVWVPGGAHKEIQWGLWWLPMPSTCVGGRGGVLASPAWLCRVCTLTLPGAPVVARHPMAGKLLLLCAIAPIPQSVGMGHGTCQAQVHCPLQLASPWALGHGTPIACAELWAMLLVRWQTKGGQQCQACLLGGGCSRWCATLLWQAWGCAGTLQLAGCCCCLLLPPWCGHRAGGFRAMVANAHCPLQVAQAWPTWLGCGGGHVACYHPCSRGCWGAAKWLCSICWGALAVHSSHTRWGSGYCTT